jgi:DNA-binding response OmpR family regulator
MARQIKEDPATAGAKVVIMTALYTSVKYRTEAFKSFKVDDYLAKPLDFNTLRSLLQKHLG